LIYTLSHTHTHATDPDRLQGHQKLKQMTTKKNFLNTSNVTSGLSANT